MRTWHRVLLAVVVLAVVAASSAGAAAEITGGAPDETAGQAFGPLRDGVRYSGAFASQNDVDYLSLVVASAGQTIQFTLANTTQSCQDPYDAGCPIYATLMDSTGQNQVGGSGSDAGTIATYGDAETFAWTFTQAGTYYLLMESDGDLPAGSPSYSVALAAVPGTGGGSSGGLGSTGGKPGGAGGSSGLGSTGGKPGGAGGSSPLIRSLKVSPHQRGTAVSATVLLGEPAVWLRASLSITHRHRGSSVIARRLYRRLVRGLHRVTVRLPHAFAGTLARGRRLSLLLRITVATAVGAQRTYTRNVTLTG